MKVYEPRAATRELLEGENFETREDKECFWVFRRREAREEFENTVR